MTSRLLRVALILVVSSNAFAAKSLCFAEKDGCRARCCTAARQKGPGSARSRLRCGGSCTEPAGNQVPSPVISVLDLNRTVAAQGRTAIAPKADLLFQQYKFFNFPPARLYASTEVYLETGSLLI